MNAPAVIALFINPSAPGNLLVTLFPDLESRRFLFTYEILA